MEQNWNIQEHKFKFIHVPGISGKQGVTNRLTLNVFIKYKISSPSRRDGNQMRQTSHLLRRKRNLQKLLKYIV